MNTDHATLDKINPPESSKTKEERIIETFIREIELRRRKLSPQAFRKVKKEVQTE